ncbi:hypothetical protein CAOG_07676 [Capsaspora owczarzaki ATCC 30864]|uniref:Uncharacterized protein n=1 Tax=Capsaspora owczarzaki (strain ATCC 30864) TaxID=595528 RepID=A0A0D2WW96_CAPO3|nr:hypothetical protein CAOG_07676 [Capsaspora owczarzaki ATCC 30864]KJE97235.1 hypothetical protein CAOG_007676 [Capsaspora owczarzaki ATCC 30864]|eukprot:XP_004343550.2 hypothetical protein CAOG_07676 [Capsaspora owczarzaki ATCC 30864]
MERVNNGGALAIAEALRVNKTVTTLSLRNNFIGHAGVQSLRKAQTVNCRRSLTFDFQRDPLALSLLPRFETAENTQTVFNLLISGPEMKDQFATLPALPVEIAELIMDEASYWQGEQCAQHLSFYPRAFTVPRNVNGASIRVKTIQALRDRKIPPDVFDDQSGESSHHPTNARGLDG